MVRDLKLGSIWVKVIMGIVTLAVPFGVYPYAIGNGVLTVTVNALIWVRYPDGSFYIPIYYLLQRGLLYGIFNLWFGLEVILNASNRRIAVLLSGALSLLFPFLVVASFITWIGDADVQTYLGPIPIQLAIGLLLMRFSGERRTTITSDENERAELHS